MSVGLLRLVFVTTNLQSKFFFFFEKGIRGVYVNEVVLCSY